MNKHYLLALCMLFSLSNCDKNLNITAPTQSRNFSNCQNLGLVEFYWNGFATYNLWSPWWGADLICSNGIVNNWNCLDVEHHIADDGVTIDFILEGIYVCEGSAYLTYPAKNCWEEEAYELTYTYLSDSKTKLSLFISTEYADCLTTAATEPPVDFDNDLLLLEFQYDEVPFSLDNID